MLDPRLLSDPQILAALAIAGALLVVALVLILRRPRQDHLADSLAELQGRLAQMAGSQAASQSSLAERLQTQERALIKGIEDDDALQHADLGGSEADAGCCIHGLQHVGHQLADAGIDGGDRLGLFLEARIGRDDDVQLGHRRLISFRL